MIRGIGASVRKERARWPTKWVQSQNGKRQKEAVVEAPTEPIAAGWA
jgi:hypothetical protein